MKKVAGVRYLYKDAGGMFYERIQTKTQNTYVSLNTTRQAQAEKNLAANRLQRFADEKGLDVEKPKKKAATVTAVLEFYEESGCPDKRGRMRYNPKTKTPPDYRELPYLAKLNEGFKDKTVDDLRPKALDAYHRERCLELSTNGDTEFTRGHRITDLELNTLNSALKWSVRQEVIPHNPIAHRSRYYSSKEARHAREVAPNSIEEVHEIAAVLFGKTKSSTLGWQWLFECHTGLRLQEALRLRMDARSDEPGSMTPDGNSFCIHPVKENDTVCNYLPVNEGFKKVIESHKAWHAKRYPKSPWHFPNLRSNGQPVAKCALTNKLRDLFQEKDKNKPHLTKQFTSHGARSFYVWARRSQGISDSQIAFELNQIGGVKTLEQVYGRAPRHWQDPSQRPNFSWTPKGEPAWTKIKSNTD